MRAPASLVPALLVLSACTHHGSWGNTSSGATASAAMRDAAGHDLGTLTIAQTPQGLVTTGTLRGLPPGTHGIHLHAVGRCEAPFASAGGHWNPAGRQHGFDNPMGPHAGDMRNLTVGADSAATVNVTAANGTLREGATPLLDADGAALVVHAGADDYRTDPAGNSGARIACGVVQTR
jgi:Cu-Zn family superoxide dismutase